MILEGSGTRLAANGAPGCVDYRGDRCVKHSKYRRILKRLVWAFKSTFGLPLNFVVQGNRFQLFPHGQIPRLLYRFDFEKEELQIAGWIMKPGMKVLDVGANVGLYSVFASRKVAPGGMVYSFEPSSETYDRLLANLALNRATNVKAAKLAVGDQPGEVSLLRETRLSDGERYVDASLAEVKSASELSDTERVRIVTLDQWAAENGLAETKFDFIKIDVEGAELYVLKGAASVISRSPDIVVLYECAMEGCRRYGHTIPDVHRVLKDYGLSNYYWDEVAGDWSICDDRTSVSGNFLATRDRRFLPDRTRMVSG